MTPVDFPGMNVVVARDQPEYRPLPSRVLEGVTTSFWAFTPEDLGMLWATRVIYYRQLTFEQPLQPTFLSFCLQNATHRLNARLGATPRTFGKSLDALCAVTARWEIEEGLLHVARDVGGVFVHQQNGGRPLHPQIVAVNLVDLS